MEIGEHILKHRDCSIKVLRAEEYPCNCYENECVEYPNEIYKSAIESCKWTNFLPILVENQPNTIKSSPHEEIPARAMPHATE